MALRLSRRVRERIGVAVRADSIYGVRVRSDTVAATAEAWIDDPSAEGVQRALETVLSGLATPRADVVVAMGVTRMQTRRLTNLPATPDVRRLKQLVTCNAHAYFVKNGVPLAISEVDLRTPGEGWSAAAELPSLALIHSACVSASLELRFVVPSVIALSYATDVAELSWRDGSVAVTARYDRDRRITGYHRRQCAVDASPEPAPGDLLALQEALGATRVPPTEPLAIRPVAFAPRQSSTVSARALALAMVCLFVASVAYVALPVGVARGLTGKVEATSHDTSAAHAAVWTERELARTTATLNTLANFQSGRIPVSLVLAHLTEAMPREMVVTDLRLDDLGGSVTVLGPHVAGLPSLLTEVPEFASPEFGGAITAQTVGAERLERVTVRFTWPKVHSPAARR